MKKLLSFTLVLCLLLCSMNALSELDISYFKEDVLEIELDSDGNAFVSSTIDRVNFAHDFSLDNYPSYVYSDVIIIDYYSKSPSAYWRWWFSYSAEKYLGITSITIDFDGVQYTFSGIGGKDHMTDYETNVRESPCIIFGLNNDDFWVHVLLQVGQLASRDELDRLYDSSFDVILHGTKDVKTAISGMAIVDLAMLGMAYSNALGGIEQIALMDEGTEMTSVGTPLFE